MVTAIFSFFFSLLLAHYSTPSLSLWWCFFFFSTGKERRTSLCNRIDSVPYNVIQLVAIVDAAVD